MRHLIARSAAVLALLAAAACGDSGDGGNPLAPDTTPQPQVLDVAHATTPGFHFLSPIATPLASYPGVFDPSRSPVVEICEWANDACRGEPVARFTTSEGTGGRRIVVDPAAEAYRVDWLTTGLPAGVTYRIAVREGVWTLGHADARRPAAGESPAALKGQGIVPIGNASSFPIRFRLERNGAPVVAITAPADGAIVPAGTPLTLAGAASDDEEGDLSSQIVWRSSQLPDPLGTGASLTVSLPSGRHAISASVTDARGATTTTSIAVVASIISAPATLNVPFGGTASLPITLSEPAPAGGLTLAVTSSAPGTAAAQQATVTIAAGARSANATLAGVVPGEATITVANPDYGMATTRVTVTAQLDITTNSVSFAQGRVAPVTIELKSDGKTIAAPAGGLAVHFTSADARCAIAAPVTIPAGLVSTTAEIVYGGSAATPCTTVLTASAPDVAGVSTDDVKATVGVAPTLSLAATRVGASLQTGVTLSLGAPAPAGGLEVTLTSADPAVLRLAATESAAGSPSITVTVPAGGTSHTVYLHGAPGAAGTAVVTATAAGYSGASATQTVAPSTVEVVNLASSTNVFAANDEFYVRVGVLNAAGTAIQAHQGVSHGVGALTATLTNGDATVGQLVRTATAAQSLTVQIQPGASNSPTTVAAGGIAFDPLGGGTTTVAASIPGFATIGGSSQTVTVNAPALSMGSTRVGASLQTSVTLSLGAAAPAGGLEVTIANSNPAVLRLAATATGAGADDLTFTVPAGQTSATIYLRGVAGQVGTATLTATAPGFTATSATQTVAQSAVELAGLGSVLTTLAANDEFYARIGVLNAAGTAIQAHQSVQPGHDPIRVTVTNGDAGVGQLVRAGQSGQSLEVEIAAGATNSPTTVAAGGIAFDPVAAGSTTVSVSAAGFATIGGSSQVVTVNAPAITVGSTRIGAGLQTSVTISLGAAAPAGGLAVTIANSNPAVLRLAASATGAGMDDLVLDVAQGTSSATVYLRGVAGQVGTATLTASAPGFTTGGGTQTVAPSAVELAGLGSATTTLSANDDFYARVGVVNAAGTAIQAHQAVAHGTGPLTVTITNGDATVGQLVRGATSAQTMTVQVAEGATNSPTTAAAGGVAFDPLGGGATTVTASAPGLVAVAGSSQVVTVSAPAITVGGTRVGAGLQTSITITLGAPAPAGGLALAVTSSAPDVLLLAASAQGEGTGALALTVPQGQTSTTVHLRGVVGRTGTAVVTASAPGFTNGTGAQTVGQTALEIVNLASSMGASAPDDAFHVRIGVLNAAGTAVQSHQGVAYGAGPLTVTLTSSDAAVARLARAAEAGQSVTVGIAEGESNSPSTVAAGGAALDPLAAGSTTVTAAAAGRPDVRSASQVVTVNP